VLFRKRIPSGLVCGGGGARRQTRLNDDLFNFQFNFFFVLFYGLWTQLKEVFQTYTASAINNSSIKFENSNGKNW